MELGTIATVAIASVITIWFLVSIKRIAKNVLQGKCGGGCSGCSGCSGSCQSQLPKKVSQEQPLTK